MGSSCKGFVLDGIEGTLVTLEAQPTFDADTGRLRVIGLPDAAVREGALRIRSALAPIETPCRSIRPASAVAPSPLAHTAMASRGISTG